ncbi:MAG: hypothetical protein ACXW1U_13925 [Methylobacter sp.]
MTAHKKAAGDGVPKAAYKNTVQRHYTPKKPPYSNQLSLSADACLIVCTGSGAWERAKFPTWFPGCKVVLPFGEDPNGYAWSMAAGHDVIIAGFGDLEPIATIAKLAGLLLAAGAGLVLYAPERGPVTRIDAKRKEAA